LSMKPGFFAGAAAAVVKSQFYHCPWDGPPAGKAVEPTCRYKDTRPEGRRCRPEARSTRPGKILSSYAEAIGTGTANSRDCCHWCAGPGSAPQAALAWSVCRCTSGRAPQSRQRDKDVLLQKMTTATAQIIQPDIWNNRLQQALALWYSAFWLLTGI